MHCVPWFIAQYLTHILYVQDYFIKHTQCFTEISSTLIIITQPIIMPQLEYIPNRMLIHPNFRCSLEQFSTQRPVALCRRRQLRSSRSSANTTQSSHPVCVEGSLRSGRSPLQAGAWGPREDEWARPSRCRHYAQHSCSCLPVGGVFIHSFIQEFP